MRTKALLWCSVRVSIALVIANPVLAEFQVNSYTTGYQFHPSVCMNTDSETVLVWYGRGSGDIQGIFGQRYDSSDAALGSEFRVNTGAANYQSYPSVECSRSDQAFVVVWQDYEKDGYGYGIAGQRFDSSGAKVGADFVVNTYTYFNQQFPDICAGSNGDFVVVWQSPSALSSSPDIFAQRYNSSGTVQGSNFQVNTTTAFDQTYPKVACTSAMDFTVAWRSHNDIRGQRFDSSGTTKGGEFQVNGSVTAYPYSGPDVACDWSDGRFVVTWGASSPAAIVARRYNSDGSAAGNEFQVNTYTTAFPQFPVVAMDDTGDFVVEWQTGEGIFGERYTSTGARADAIDNQIDQTASHPGEHPAIAAQPNGTDSTNVEYVWQRNYDGDNYGVFARRIGCL